MKATRRSPRHWPRCWAVAFLLLACTFPALAHKLSDGYLSLTVTNQQLVGRLEISLHDFEQSLGLDANGDGNVTWGEVQQREAEIKVYVQTRVAAAVDGTPVAFRAQALQINQRNDGGYVVVPLITGPWKGGHELTLNYSLMFDVDPLHLGLLKLEIDGTTKTGIFASDRRSLGFSIDPAVTRSTTSFGFLQFVREGVWHIWTGYDHILFLIALLLPAVLVHSGRQWHPTPAFKPALINVLKVVTAFTLAHSLTLSLAVLDVVRMPSRLVESTIAASVVLAAANNLKPFFRDRGWIVAFAFGLVHGFGFASALGELDLPRSALASGLVGFNLGVEIGQLAIVSLFMPIAFLMRSTWVYRRMALQAGSAVICLVAGGWCVERIFNLVFMPF
jgi:hypothetical protein